MPSADAMLPSAAMNDFFKDFIDDQLGMANVENGAGFTEGVLEDSFASFLEDSTSVSSPDSEDASPSVSNDGTDETDHIGANDSAGSIAHGDELLRTSEQLSSYISDDTKSHTDDLIMPPTPPATETRTSMDSAQPYMPGSADMSTPAKAANEPCAPLPSVSSNVAAGPASFSATSTQPMLRLNLMGIPTKSRVETQIRLGIQLQEIVVDAHGRHSIAPAFDRFRWLKLPTWTMAKEKLKVKNRKDAPSTINPHEIVFLDCKVVKSSEPFEEVTICPGCIVRERKRAQRKKDLPMKRDGFNTSNSIGDAQDLTPLPDEERKIMVFNCPELLELSAGHAFAPMRVTCYCRHHKEKDGFRVIINLRDATGALLASTTSDIILITDDHKTTGKVDKTQREETTTVTGAPFPPRPAYMGPPVASCLSTELNLPSASTPGPISSRKRKSDSLIAPTSTSSNGKLAKVPSSLSMTRVPTGASPHVPQPQQIAPYPQSAGGPYRKSSEEKKVKRSPSQDSLMMFMNVHEDGSEISSPTQSLKHLPSGLTSPNVIQDADRFSLSPRARHAELAGSVDPRFAPMHAVHSSSGYAEPPAVSRLIPAEGPLRGGIEVTILGSGFYPGLTAMFGDVPAVPTHCWSATTMVCVLPPAMNAGPVMVSFKEFPTHLQHTAVKHFTYVDETDRALMELALQVIGLKTSGRLENARDVALRICGSSAPTHMVDANMSNVPVSRLRAALGVDESDDLEEMLCACMRYLGEVASSHPLRISHRSKSGHTLLHLATLQGYTDLVQDLVDMGASANVRDRNGYTSLHLAASASNNDIAAILVAEARANCSLLTCDGRTAYDIASHHDDVELLAIVDPWSAEEAQSHAHQRRLSRTSACGSEASVDSVHTLTATDDDFSRSRELHHHRSITQPNSRAASPERSSRRNSQTEDRAGRRRSKSVGRAADLGESADGLAADLIRFSAKLNVNKARCGSRMTDRSEPKTSSASSRTARNLTQLQQSWLDLLANAPPWLQKTLQSTPSIPDIFKPSSLSQIEMPQSIAAFQAIIPAPSRLVTESNETIPVKGTASTTDGTWLQSLVSHLSAPPSYQEATASIPILRDLPHIVEGSSSRADAITAAVASSREGHGSSDGDSASGATRSWLLRRSVPLRSQGRIEQMTPEELREQARRSKKKSDTMMTFFWLPCFCLFIIISVFQLFFDKVAGYILSL
ncbi:SPT3 Dosage dependent suppressor of Ty-induced promoter mutations-like protein [Savitreella phatthalungensis]